MSRRLIRAANLKIRPLTPSTTPYCLSQPISTRLRQNHPQTTTSRHQSILHRYIPDMTTPPASVAAPWRAAFLDDISAMHEPDASLATVSPAPPSSSSSSPPSLTSFIPRVRTVIIRCMFASMKPHPANPANQNPAVFSSELPTFTTDVRMGKVAEIFASSPDPGTLSATGGGGPVELVFWAEPRKVQWRLAGRAYVLGPDVEDDTASAKRVRDIIRERMHVVGAEEQVKEWSWAREVTAIFGNLSPEARGWFRHPPSGRALDGPMGDDGLGLGQTVNDLEDELARKNFRVVVVVPDAVDKVDLSDPKRGKRWSYRFSGGSWETEELWP